MENKKTHTLILDYLFLIIGITDGVPWLRNRITDTFIESVAIPGFYNATEHLHQFCELHYINNGEGVGRRCKANCCWKEGAKRLLAMQRRKVVAVRQGRQLQNNAVGMQTQRIYKRNQQIKGGIIGSGALHSAHRTVVQKRMKLLGQR